MKVESIIAGIDSEVASFKVYPNPTKSVINIVSARPAREQFQVKNVLGTTIKSFHVKGSAMISVEDLAPGIYFVTNGRETVRVLKMP